MTLDIQRIREDFPILGTKVHGRDLVYLDSGATSQKPRSVMDALTSYYTSTNANVHRGAYWLSQEATAQYEAVRDQVAELIHIDDSSEVIYTKGTTEAINLVASSWGQQAVQPGDDVVVTRMEHHANFVPWQQLAKAKGANFKIVELDEDFRLDMKSLDAALSGKPRILAVTLMSNVLGTINPVREIAEKAKAAGAVVVVDAAQAIAHGPLNVKELGPIDFLAFSAHKMCGPTGVGILWGRRELLESMPPYQYGGDMILQVQDQETKWNELPWKFEAGTPNIADVIAFGRAIEYLQKIGMDHIAAYEKELTVKALNELSEVPGLKLIGPRGAENRGGALSFVLEGVHPHDLATFLDAKGIAVRAGHHCAQPLAAQLGVASTTRASFYFYNTPEEVTYLANALREAKTYFEGGI